ncbi:MAG: class I SAM-dependent methyltransferase [Betaproteobacteria bacterium]|nr:class I SAM-dependent methyltransferase [Betaproteobacteria bacterium]
MVSRFRRMLHSVAESPIGVWLTRPLRFWFAVSYYCDLWGQIPIWLFKSRERTNFTYDYTELGNAVAIEIVSLVTRVEPARIAGFANELTADIELRRWLSSRIELSPYRYSADTEIRFSRGLLFYLFVRALKPRVIVEAGTDKGLSACLIAAALQRNKAEGVIGQVYALDVREDRGFLLGDRFADVAILRFGDSVDFLNALEGTIDFFIHDTTAEQQHEKLQYKALESKLSPKAITISTWFTGEFVRFSQRNGRRFLLFPEIPQNHWYPGGRFPVSFAPDRPEPRR